MILQTCLFFFSVIITANVMMTECKASEFTGNLLITPEFRDPNHDSLFFIPTPFQEFNKYSSRQDVELKYQRKKFNLLATDVSNINNNGDCESKGILNEAYYDANIAGQEISIGKKIMNWGVGYGFRPLDVIQQENRQKLFLRTLEGVPQISWDYFTEKNAVTLSYINPFQGKNDDHLDEESIAFKCYFLLGNMDMHAVARLSERNKIEGGTGFSYIANESLEWHASALYQYRYEKWLTRLTESGSSLLADGTMQQDSFYDGIKELIGFTWTHSSGISVLGEFWFDNSSYSKNEWNDLRTHTQSKLNLLSSGIESSESVYSNIGESSKFFSQSNLLQQNMLMRLSYDDGQNTVSALNYLYTPQDGGFVLTASISHEFNPYFVELGLQTFGGDADSAYRAVPEDLIVYLTWKVAFAL